MEIPVQKLTQGDSGRWAAKLLAPFTHPAVPHVWGRACRPWGSTAHS